MPEPTPHTDPLPLDYAPPVNPAVYVPPDDTYTSRDAAMILVFNLVSVGAGVAWSIASWRENLRDALGGLFGPVIYLGGTGLLLFFQLTFCLLPSLRALARQGKQLPRWLRMVLLISGIAGFAITM
jgi:hypothetical protein